MRSSLRDSALSRRDGVVAHVLRGSAHGYEQQAAWLHMPCAAQHQFYQERSTQTDFLIMLRDAVPVGRLYVAHWQDEIRMVGIAVLPPSRHAGIGTAIRRDILA